MTLHLLAGWDHSKQSEEHMKIWSGVNSSRTGEGQACSGDPAVLCDRH